MACIQSIVVVDIVVDTDDDVIVDFFVDVVIVVLMMSLLLLFIYFITTVPEFFMVVASSTSILRVPLQEPGLHSVQTINETAGLPISVDHLLTTRDDGYIFFSDVIRRVISRINMNGTGI